MNPSHAIPDDVLRRSVLAGCQACLKAGVYPSEAELKKRRVRGDGSRIIAMREELIAAGEIAIPDRLTPAGRYKLGRPNGASSQAGAQPVPEPKPQIREPREVLRPCGDDVAQYRVAWRRRRKGLVFSDQQEVM